MKQAEYVAARPTLRYVVDISGYTDREPGHGQADPYLCVGVRNDDAFS